MKKLNLLSRHLLRLGELGSAKDILLLKRSYLVSDMSDLKKYLTDDSSRGFEVAELNRSAFFEWLESSYDKELINNYGHEGGEEDIWSYDIDSLPEGILKKYYKSGWWEGKVDEEYDPTWNCMKYIGLIKNEWLIHFTDDAYSIARSGFKYGVDDLSRLCLTTHFGQNAKKSGGYNFAFTASYTEKLRPSRGRYTYGEEAVLFKANGIEVYHHGDQEYQVIFKGSTARDIIPLRQSGGSWYAGDYDKEFEKLEDLVSWVINNFDQYKRILLSDK